MNIGDTVLLPRTGGGKSKGIIIEIWGDRARVKYKIGNTYHGKPAPEIMKDQCGYKTVQLKELKLIME